MDQLAAHRSAMRQFDDRVALVKDDQWNNDTPDTDWDVRSLVSHLVSEQLWAPPLMDGRTVAEVGDQFEGDVLGENPRSAWKSASAASRAAFKKQGAMNRAVHLSFGTVPASVYLRQMTLDLVVHAWDLARAIGADEQMPNDLVSAALDEAKQQAAELQSSGLFAPPIPVPGCTDDLTELLALLGRQRW